MLTKINTQINNKKQKNKRKEDITSYVNKDDSSSHTVGQKLFWEDILEFIGKNIDFLCD